MIHSMQDYKEITLDHIILENTFSPRTVTGLRSMKDGIHYTTLEGGRQIVKYSYETGEVVDVIFSVKELEENRFSSFSGYEFSDDESMLLITTGREQIYRHSYRADFYVWDIETKTLFSLFGEGKEQLATFSPCGRKIAFVFENNLYYRNLESGEIVRITSDGRENYVINGAPDWVYEEEFSFNKAFEWSPDGKKIAFYRFDESDVKMFNMTIYGELYPHWYSFKYPKAGEENSLVTIHVYDLENEKTVLMDTGDETDQYIPRIKWTKDPGKLCIYRLNRLQNHIELLFADPVTGSSGIVFSEKNKYFISETGDNFVTFLDDNEHFVIMSERSGWMHFYLYDMEGDLMKTRNILL